ncbi:NF-kappa-B inhibitor delta isoform X1 [Tachysurus fulvidraco]|uniref:NF-kappa-B inhibitor delta isoform X1 n=1 Tax=Tachysurus fulvidraco TaxID=1234273 RepID=UPI001FEF3CB8|nr:NF-kappa-B inhibitor delta isoform X1 [Tachysurus fulvidraco]
MTAGNPPIFASVFLFFCFFSAAPKEKPCYTLPTVKKLLEQKRKRETSSAPPSCASATNNAVASASIPVPTSDTSSTANNSFSDMTSMKYDRWDVAMQPHPSAFLDCNNLPSMCLNYLTDPSGGLNLPPAVYSPCLTMADPQSSSYTTLPLQECQSAQMPQHFQPRTECPVTAAMPGSSADHRTQGLSVPSSGYLWSSGPRASTGPCMSVRPQMDMDMAKLEEARLFLQAMDYNRTIWKDDDGDTILHIYTAKGQREYAFAAAERLKELGTLDTKEHRGKTALMVAVTANQPEIVRDLLCLGADISICDIEGQTALHLAATYGFPHVMEVILSMKHRVDLEARNFEGLTPLHCAVISHNATMKALTSTSSSSTAWLPECDLQSQAKNKLICLQLLLEAGASLLRQEIKSNKTVLHLAVKEGNIQLVNFFLLKCQLPDMQAFINMKAHGHTALHMAAGLHGSPYQEELIRLLLSKGADPSIRNLENDQPVHLLQTGEQGEKLKLILKKKNASRRRITSLQDQE